MATIQQIINKKFLEHLSKSDHFSTERIEQLSRLLAADKPVKAEQLIELFTQPQSGGLG